MKNIMTAGWRRAALALATMTCLSLLASSARATDYYVDSVAGLDTNNGTAISTPWKTLTKVNGITFLAGDKVLFKRGSAWTGTLTPRGSGTIGNPLVFDAYGTGAAPIINGAGAANAVMLWSKNYFTFQNFNVTNDAATEGYRAGIRLSFIGAASPAGVTTYRSVKILNNEVHHVAGSTNRNAALYDTAAIYVEFSDYQGAQTHVDDLLIEGNDIHDNRAIGLYVKAAPNYGGRQDLWATNLVVRANIFDQGGADHIVINGANGPLLEYNAGYDAGLIGANYIYIAGMWTCYFTREAVFQFNEVARTRNEFANGTSGDSQAFDVDYGTYDTHTFQYNYTHDNAGGVLIMMPKENKTGAVDLVKTVIYRYNLSVNDARNTSTGCQFAVHPVFGVNSAHIYNNVFYSTRAEGFKFTDVQAAYYSNNVFYTPSAVYPTKPTFTNNAYYGHNPDVNDPYKVVANPLFVGPLPGATGADGFLPANIDLFKLQPASPLINAGKGITVPINNGGFDFFGNALYAATYADIGMHEVVGGTRPAPPAVTFADNTPGSSVVYTGSGWTHTADTLFYNSTRSDSITVGNSVQYSFTGTNVSVFGKRGPGLGKINVSIDGGTPVLVDCYWGQDRWRDELFQATGLSATAHTITVTVAAKNPASSYNRVAIDYFQRMPGTPPANPVATTIDDPSSAVVSYSGTWTPATGIAGMYAGTRTASASIGSYVNFTFTGTGARIYGSKHTDYGKLSVSIDGGPATVVNCYDPGIDWQYMVKLYEVTGLSSGPHTLRATVAAKDALATANNISIDCFQSLVGGGSPVDVIVDNAAGTGVTLTGTWVPQTYTPGYYGSNYLHDDNIAKGSKSARFTPVLPESGTYEVFAWWAAGSNRASNVPIDIVSTGGTTTVQVNQQINGGQWVSLGTYAFDAGTTGSVLIRNTATNGYVIADAVRFTKQQSASAEVIMDNTAGTGVTLTGAWVPQTYTPGYYGSNYLHDDNISKGSKSVRFTPTLPTSGTYEVFAWWAAGSNRASNVPIDIVSTGGTTTVQVNQQINGGQWVSLGSYAFDAGTTGSVLIRNTATNGYVIADAIRFSKP